MTNWLNGCVVENSLGRKKYHWGRLGSMKCSVLIASTVTQGTGKLRATHKPGDAPPRRRILNDCKEQMERILYCRHITKADKAKIRDHS